jgi:hypothetical protein
VTASAFVVAAVAGITAGAVAYSWRDRGAHLGWTPLSGPAVAAVRNCPGRLFNDFAGGGALTWFIPERSVFVDSRGIEAYPMDLLRRTRNADLSGDYRQLFDDYGVRCAIVDISSPVARRLRVDPMFHEQYSDQRWAVYAAR